MSASASMVGLHASRQAACTHSGRQARGFHGLARNWLARRRYRCELRRLLRTGPHLVDDIGMPPDVAMEEACKPFWRA
jgi:uncharacterized protein YjiS (DUF1127 family)